MSSTQPRQSILRKILFTVLGPIARPMAEMQERLARVEQRVNPLEHKLDALTYCATDDIKRHEDIMRRLDELRDEVNSSAQLVSESSVYVERIAREVAERAGKTDAARAPARPAGP